jgi:hypothetical protein
MAKQGQEIIWRSKHFPLMVLTRAHLEMLRYAYPEIERYEPELKRAEAWLFANPARHPKKNWKNFINSWMRKAVEIKKRPAPGGARQGDAAERTPHDPRIISDIMNRQDRKD